MRWDIPRFVRGFAKVVLRLDYLLFRRHRHNHTVLELVAGRPLLVLPQVMNPKLFRTGEFLAQSLSPALIPIGSRVVDMGTGSGVVAISAAQWAKDVTAIDINPEAVRCASINALLNHAEERVRVLLGDLFAPVPEEKFDVVLFNPPYYRGTPRSEFERALHSNDIVERFTHQLRDHLAPNGCALILLSTDGDTPAFLELFRANRFTIEIVAERDLVNERLTLYRLS